MCIRDSGSGFVIHLHDGNQNRIITDGRFQLLHIDAAFRIHTYICNFKAHFLQTSAGLQYRRMLHLRGHNPAAPALSGHRGSEDRHTVRFRSAGGKINGSRFSSHGFHYLFPGFFYRFFRRDAQAVKRGRVSEILPHIGQHRIRHLIMLSGGRAVI